MWTILKPRSLWRLSKAVLVVILFLMAFMHIYQQWLKKQDFDAEKLAIYSEKLKAEKDLKKLQRSHINQQSVDTVDTSLVDLKIDWHDWNFIANDLKRIGPGEQGKPVLLSKEEESIAKSSYDSNGFNGYASDKISLDRAIKDIRHPLCKGQEYLAALPKASIIIPYYNEHWSTLMRTVHSVIHRSPSELIHEVILVDDNSSKEHCKTQVDDYLKTAFPAVKSLVIHLEERKGLIGARLAGARAAEGQVLLFLDSHTEANVNWLPPLLEPIALNESTAVCPFIDVIAYDTFEYRAQDEGARGAFDWEMYYKRLPLLPKDLENPIRPFDNPVMAGGLFAISASFFWKLGGYDEGLQIWGGEQYELSFKIWQCGGRLVDAPCSRVGHVYRKFAPFSFGGNLGRNYKRVAAVWMDEYIEYIYKRRPSYRDIDPGDIGSQVALRQRLQCQSFKWFMQNVAFDLPKKYPPIEPPDFASGFIKSMADSSMCIDALAGVANQRIGVKSCSSQSRHHQQRFKLGWQKDLRYGQTLCFDVSIGGDRAPVNFYACHGGQGNQLWRYNEANSHIVHVNSNRCLTLEQTKGRSEVFVAPCVNSNQRQKWSLENVNLKALAQWESDQ